MRGKKRTYLLGPLIFLLILMASMGCAAGEEAAPAQNNQTPLAASATGSDLPLLENPPDAAIESAEIMIGREAAIDAVEIVILESFPVQVNAMIRGSLPDSCVTIDQVNQARTGNNFEIALATARDTGVMCTTQQQPFQETVSLDVLGLPAGTYTVTATSANSVSNTFALTVDNRPPEVSPTPELVDGSISGIVWDDACQLLADDTPSEGCIAVASNGYRANGVFDADERRIPGVEVALNLGDCPAGEAPIGFSSTDESGTYLFTGLSAGTYCVSIDLGNDTNASLLLPGDWTYPETGVGETTVTLADDNFKTADFGWDYQFDVPVEAEPDTGSEAEAEPAAACQNAAQYVADVTIPDDTVFAPGETFVKTWRVRNQGDCAWGAGYELVFSGGDQLGGAEAVPFSDTAEPGGEADLSVALTAPSEPGTYRGEWKFRSPDGTIFGSNGDFPIYVQIVVEE